MERGIVQQSVNECKCNVNTGVSHLPEDVGLEDLGHVARDGAEQAAAGVASRGVPEA